MLNISWRRCPAALAILGLLAACSPVSAQQPPDPMPEESPLLIEPASVEESFEAASLMQRLGRPNLAKRYLKQILDANPDDATLLEIRDKEGPAVFLRMANDRDLQPEAKTLLDRVNTAFRQRGADPQRINQLIDDLSQGPRAKAVALESLKSGGAVVVPQMLAKLAAGDNNEKSSIISALIAMGRQVVPPLLGALESPDMNIRGGAIEVLGYLATEDEAAFLWRPAFGPNEPPGIQQSARNALTQVFKPEGRRTFQISPYGAPARLKREAEEFYRNKYKKQGNETVTIWAWHPQNQTVASIEMPAEDASYYQGVKLARDGLALSPENQELQSLFIGLSLARAVKRSGWNAPLPTGPNTAYQYALSSGPEVVAEALTDALRNKNVPAAVAALQVLGQIDTRSQLYATAHNSPILRALDYPDPRVQFAAAVTILQLDPNREFPGAGRVVQILARSLADSGGPAVVVIDPNASRANNVAGQFQQIGYRGQAITKLTGQDGFAAAVQRNDVELVAIQANVTQWTLSQTIANFRADSRTAHLPIVIYGPDWAEPNVRRLVNRSPNTVFALEAVTLDFFRAQVEPLLSRLDSEPLTQEERAAQAAAGAYWLAHLARARRTNVFDLTNAESALIQAVENPNIADNAVQALGAIPSKAAQRRLQSVAVSDVYQPTLRELAAIQLAFHIQRHGLLLNNAQVAEVRSALAGTADPQLASALASVTGSLKPNAAAVGNRLQQFPIANPLLTTP